MEKYPLSKTYDKTLVLVAIIAIIYSIFGLFADADSTGKYIGTILLSFIVLLLSLSTFILIRMSKKHM